MTPRTRSRLISAAVMLCLPLQAFSIPVLQLYIEGSIYDAGTQTWYMDSGTSDFRIWAIGNVSGPGGKGGLPIENVRLSAAYARPVSGPAPTITVAPTRVGGSGTFTGGSTTITDPSVSDAPAFLQTRTDGSSPLLGDGSPLPSHGIYGAGTDWQEWGLGDFTRTDSPIADFTAGFPTRALAGKAQISAYDVRVTGDASLRVHFDLYDHVGAGNHVKFSFAPFSHDAEVTTGGGAGGSVPEPASLALLGLGLVALGWARKHRRKLYAA